MSTTNWLRSEKGKKEGLTGSMSDAASSAKATPMVGIRAAMAKRQTGLNQPAPAPFGGLRRLLLPFCDTKPSLRPIQPKSATTGRRPSEGART